MWPFTKKEKTEAEAAIDNIKADIKARKDEIKILKAQDATPWRENTAFRGYLHTVKFLTTPFTKLNIAAHGNLSNPEAWAQHQLLNKACKVLNYCEAISEEENRRRIPKAHKGVGELLFEVQAEVQKDEDWKSGPRMEKRLAQEAQRLEKLLDVMKKYKAQAEADRAAKKEAAVEAKKVIELPKLAAPPIRNPRKKKVNKRITRKVAGGINA